AEGEPERYSRRRGIVTVPDRHAAPDSRDVPTEHAADGGSPDRDAAGPDEEDLLGMRDVVGQLIDDVDEPCADDAADNSPRGDRPAVLLTDLAAEKTQRKPDAEKDANGRENPVPRERDGTEMNVGVEGNLNQRRSVEPSRVLSPARGRALAAPSPPSASLAPLAPRGGCPGHPRHAHNPLAGPTRDASRGLSLITFHGTS